MAEMSTRSKHGTPYDTITFTGTLTTNSTNLWILHVNNTDQAGGVCDLIGNATTVPFIWGPSPEILTWGSVNLIQPFTLRSDGTGEGLYRCTKAFCTHFPFLQCDVFSCNMPGLDCNLYDSCHPSGQCAQPAASGLSMLVSTSTCPEQVQPSSPIAPPASSTNGEGSSSPTKTGLSGPLIAAIVIPVVMVCGVVIAVAIYIIHRRSVVNSTKMLHEMAKQDSINDMKRMARAAQMSPSGDTAL